MTKTDNIRQIFNLSLDKYGISDSDLEAELSKFSSLKDKIDSEKSSGMMPFLDLPESKKDLAKIKSVAENFRNRFERLIVFGVGGSSLGARALVESANIKPPYKKPIFIDASDPLTFERNLEGVSFAKTGFLVISKSGKTLETLMQMLLIMENTPFENFILITDPGDNPLRRIATEYKIEVIDHDPNLVGRFSVMSLVGLIPAAYAGMNIQNVRNGAQKTLKNFFKANSIQRNTIVFASAASVALAKKGINIDVMMPYVDRLKTFTLWHRQLWAESLGKDGFGMTPLVASGSADQHSQLQLYLDGPRDKLFTIICLDSPNQAARVSPIFANIANMPWLANKGMANLNHSMADATIETLISHELPVRKIVLSTLNDGVMGELMMHYILETIVAAEMLGVNAFDQPAVERIKSTSSRKMGRVIK